jgi:hypothetical protein
MPDRSGLATTTFGAAYWRERVGSKLVALRRSRRARSDIAQLGSGIVHVRGIVRAIGPTIAAPLSGRPAVFGRVLACLELRHRAPYGESFLQTDARERVVHADLVFGGPFLLEDATGRTEVHVGSDDPFELLLPPRRLFSAHRGPELELLRRFAATSEGAGLAPDDDRMVHAEWILEEGRELSVIATVRTEEASSEDRDYRGLVRARGLASSVGHPICFFE